MKPTKLTRQERRQLDRQYYKEYKGSWFAQMESLETTRKRTQGLIVGLVASAALIALFVLLTWMVVAR